MVGEIQVSLKSNKNKGYFTWRTMHIYDYICVFFLERKMFQAEVVEKIQKRHFVFNKFFRKRVVYEIMLKIKVQPYRWQVTIKYWQWAWHSRQIRLQRKCSLNWRIEERGTARYHEGGPVGCREKSVNSYQHKLRNISEERRSRKENSGRTKLLFVCHLHTVMPSTSLCTPSPHGNAQYITVYAISTR